MPPTWKIRLRRYFASHREVLVVYLYGSQAAKQAGPSSDVDIAIILNGSKRQHVFETTVKFRGDLETLLRTSVDVVILNEADLFLCHQVLTKGKSIFVRDEAQAEAMKWRLLRHAWDFLPLKRYFDDQVLRRLAAHA